MSERIRGFNPATTSSAEAEKNFGMSTEVLSGDITEPLLKEIGEVEAASFPVEMQEDAESLKELLENPLGVHVLLRDHEHKAVGYVTSLPHDEAFEYLKDFDKELTPDPGALYIESLAVKPENRRLLTTAQLIDKFFKEAQNRGYKRVSMHARVSEGLAPVLAKKFDTRTLQHLENWYDFGEPFDYIEIDLPELEEKK